MHVYTHVQMCRVYVHCTCVCMIPAVLFPTRVTKSGRKYAPKSSPSGLLGSRSRRGWRRHRTRAHRGQGLSPAGREVVSGPPEALAEVSLPRDCESVLPQNPQAAPQPHNKPNNQAFSSPENLLQRWAAKRAVSFSGICGQNVHLRELAGNLGGRPQHRP